MFGTVLVIVAVLAYGNCESTACNVTETTADCGEHFEFPLDLDTNITKLIVRSMHVKSIEYEDLSHYTDLEVIDFSNCALETISPEAFVDSENLKELILSGNKALKWPDNGTFISSNSLQILNLSSTDLTTDTLQHDIFEGTPYLVTIDLSLNAMEGLDAFPFSKTKDLVTLILSKDDSINKTSLCATNLQEIIFKMYQSESSIAEETYECAKHEYEEEGFIETSTIIPMNGEDLTTELEDITTMNPPEPEETSIDSDDDTLDSSLMATNSSQANETSEVSVIIENITMDESATELVTNEAPEDDQNTTEGNAIDAATSAGTETRLLAAQNEENKDEDTDKTAPTTAAIGKGGTNIVLGIILCVMIVGALGFAWKYYKSRKSGYRTANTDDKDEEEGKELKTIVTHSKEPAEQHN